MKIVIDKNGNHTHIELTYDTARKPLALDLDRGQLEALLSLLTTARNANNFKFTWETS